MLCHVEVEWLIRNSQDYIYGKGSTRNLAKITHYDLEGLIEGKEWSIKNKLPRSPVLSCRPKCRNFMRRMLNNFVQWNVTGQSKYPESIDLKTISISFSRPRIGDFGPVQLEVTYFSLTDNFRSLSSLTRSLIFVEEMTSCRTCLIIWRRGWSF